MVVFLCGGKKYCKYDPSCKTHFMAIKWIKPPGLWYGVATTFFWLLWPILSWEHPSNDGIRFPYDHYRWCFGPHCKPHNRFWPPGPSPPSKHWTWELPPPRIDSLLVTSGGHQSTYSWQVGGTHPTGMLSCCIWGCSLEGASWWNHWEWRVVLSSIFLQQSYINRYLWWKILRAQGKHF